MASNQIQDGGELSNGGRDLGFSFNKMKCAPFHFLLIKLSRNEGISQEHNESLSPEINSNRIQDGGDHHLEYNLYRLLVSCHKVF